MKQISRRLLLLSDNQKLQTKDLQRSTINEKQQQKKKRKEKNIIAKQLHNFRARLSQNKHLLLDTRQNWARSRA